MKKRKLYFLYKKLLKIKIWYLLFLLALSGIVCITALRQNNLKMLGLKAIVITADQQNGDTETALRNLRQFVYSHMNTNLASGTNGIRPPIQLKGRYDRLVQAERDHVTAVNSGIYTQAQSYCEKTIPSGLSGRSRVPCIQEYVSTHGVTEQPIPDALYKFDFLSPGWSPDLAGWTLVASILISTLLAIRIATGIWFKKQLHDHN